MSFRPLSEEEKKIFLTIFERERNKLAAESLEKQIDDFQVMYVHDGNFTVATIVADFYHGILIGSGASKRNPIDEPNDRIGEIKAFHRAASNVPNYLEFAVSICS
jgi:hypothetical protein